MANIALKIELAEQNQSGPYYNAYYTNDCVGALYTGSVESPIFLPTVGSEAIITVDEDYECIKLESIGTCTNELISGSTTTTSTTTTSTTTTSTTTTSTTTTTTTTTTTAACSEWDLFCPSTAAGGFCSFDVDCCAGNTVRYFLGPDQDAVACVEAGGSVSVVTVSGVATPSGISCSSDCGDVTSTTTTSTTSTTSTSTTTSTTTTTTINPAECIEYELDCRSGAVGSGCSFSWDDCEGNPQSVSLMADFSTSVCALSGSAFITSVSGYVEEGDQCYYAFTLEYGSISCSSVCSNYPGGNSQLVYLDVDNFALANNIYSDLIGTPADANFWTDGTQCRASDGFGALGTSTSC